MTSTDTPTRPAATPRDTAGVISLLAGVLGIFLLPIVLGPLAIITGFVGLSRSDQKTDTGNCVIGMVCGAVAVVVMLVRFHEVL